MIEILKTNNPVTLSFAQSCLKDSGIEAIVMDNHMSILEGSLGVIPRRIMVPDGQIHRARRVLQDAGLGEFDQFGQHVDGVRTVILFSQ